MPAVYLIPSLLQEEGIDAIPPYITEAIKNCQVFFVENERTTRRFFKQLWKAFLPEQEIIIDDYEWLVINEASGLHTSHTGYSLLGRNVFIAADGFAYHEAELAASPRIGVDYAGQDALLPYRFYVKNNPFISGKKGKG